MESMHLKVLLPFGVFMDKQDITRIVVETRQGAFGLLPNRLDCTGAIVPGILTYQAVEQAEEYLAIDRGIMVKAGPEVLVSVRNAFGGMELGKLHEAVTQEFLQLDEREKEVRSVLYKMETRFIRQFQQLQQH